MDFYDWMMKRYEGKDTPRGDLAGDMKHEADFPKGADRERILEYLDWKGACEDCVAVFKRCWRDYKKAVAYEGE